MTNKEQSKDAGCKVINTNAMLLANCFTLTPRCHGGVCQCAVQGGPGAGVAEGEEGEDRALMLAAARPGPLRVNMAPQVVMVVLRQRFIAKCSHVHLFCC